MADCNDPQVRRSTRSLTERTPRGANSFARDKGTALVSSKSLVTPLAGRTFSPEVPNPSLTDSPERHVRFVVSALLGIREPVKLA